MFQQQIKNASVAKYLKNMYRTQANDSTMYFCIEFIDFMLEGKSLLDYINLFSTNEYEKNYKIILTYFQDLKTRCFFY